MAEFGHNLNRRDFIKAGGLLLASWYLASNFIPFENQQEALPEKPIRKNQAALFIMPNFTTIGQDTLDFEKAAGHRVQGISLFADLDLKPPSELLIDAIFRGDRAVMINLQPRPTFDEEDRERRFTPAQFEAGMHDKMLKNVAKTFSRFAPLPVFVRLAFEMNGNWFNWGGNPRRFKETWNYVVDYMRSEGADNVKWIFSPNYLPDPDKISEYYPGDDRVDVVGADMYDWEQREPDFAVSPINFHLKAMAPNKPIIVGEIGAAGESQDTWLSRAIYLNLANGVSALNYFQMDKEKKWALRDPKTLPLVRKIFDSGAFLDESSSLNKINQTILSVN